MTITARGVALAVAGVVVTASLVAGTATVVSSGTTSANANALAAGSDQDLLSNRASAEVRLRREHMRLIYERMNLRTEELRQEENKPHPNRAVVARLKAQLRKLASEL
jgi:hypothetical protein